MKNAVQFYDALKIGLQRANIPVISVKEPQSAFKIPYTLVIPFDQEQHGLSLLLLEVADQGQKSYSLVITTSFTLAKTDKLTDLAVLINDINLISPLPGWILNEKENMLHYKYVFPCASDNKVDSKLFVFIKQIYQNISRYLPLIVHLLTDQISLKEAQQRLLQSV